MQTNKQAIAALNKLNPKKHNGKYVLYKVTTKKYKSPNSNGSHNRPVLTYNIGETLTDSKPVNRHTYVSCGAGLNLLTHRPKPAAFQATKSRNASPGASSSNKLLEVEVSPKNIGCVPDNSSIFGQRKIRVGSCKIIKELNTSSTKTIKPKSQRKAKPKSTCKHTNITTPNISRLRSLQRSGQRVSHKYLGRSNFEIKCVACHKIIATIKTPTLAQVA